MISDAGKIDKLQKFISKVKDRWINCSYNRKKYYLTNFIILTLIIILYYCLFKITHFIDLIQIFSFAIIFYKLFDYIKLTKSSIKKLFNISFIIVIFNFILDFFGINLFSEIYCDSDDEDDGKNSD